MEQWGRNLSKYDGIQMLGGVKLNGRQILEDGTKMREKLEQEIRTTFELPIRFNRIKWHFLTTHHRIMSSVITLIY